MNPVRLRRPQLSCERYPRVCDRHTDLLATRDDTIHVRPDVLGVQCCEHCVRAVKGAAAADVWDIPRGDNDDFISRRAMLDRFCAEIGRDPASIRSSIARPVSYDQPGTTREAIAAATGPASGDDVGHHPQIEAPGVVAPALARFLSGTVTVPG